MRSNLSDFSSQHLNAS